MNVLVETNQNLLERLDGRPRWRRGRAEQLQLRQAVADEIGQIRKERRTEVHDQVQGVPSEIELAAGPESFLDLVLLVAFDHLVHQLCFLSRCLELVPAYEAQTEARLGN